MTDTLSKEERSSLMSKVSSGDTKPEWILRCALHRLGFRYRLKNRRLAGNPDLVFPKYRTVIFVHGCFWHRHPDCKDATFPKTNRDIWGKKFAENVRRDANAVEALTNQGWQVIVVWECELVNKTIETIESVVRTMRSTQLTPFRIGLERRALLTAAEERVRYRIDKKTMN